MTLSDLFSLERWRSRPPTVAVVRLEGAIQSGGRWRSGVSLASMAGPLEKAFGDKRHSAVALAINSPGGSPVQSALIARRVRELSTEKGKPVYAFVEDVAASGGYWLACAADEIYADESSIVGSIGVIAAGFGLDSLIARIGVTRRIYTAGTRKSILDPFEPERPEDVAKLEALQHNIHKAFKDLVRERRGDRLKADDAALFDGEFWTGAEALDLGLIDGLGHMRTVLRRKYGDKVRLRVVGARKSLSRRLGLRAGGAASWPDDLLATVEERALWQRFGL